MAPDWFKFHPEVQSALNAGIPVVALESAVVTHGLPRPINLELARRMQAEIQKAGAVPAITGMIQGSVYIGLPPEQLEALSLDDQAIKISRRDIPIARAMQLSGGTTVAAAVFCARVSGIGVFATGGIGGVHPGSGGDVSADLIELARNKVAVVCSGAKAVLDLPRTLEALETLGVPVLGYQTDELPAFYSRSSGLALPASADTIQQIAEILRAHWESGLEGGVLVCVPCPEADALPAEQIEGAIRQAQEDAASRQVTGPALTPFLLSQVADLSGGRALAANLALLRNNARVAAEIAREIGDLSGL
jgi:pseudouridine-5'-phosphate glycosidase